jgi:hypothetical protein
MKQAMGAAIRSSHHGAHRFVRFAVVIGLLLALALSATAASAAPPSTSTTVVVTANDISSGTGTVNDSGWFTGDTRSGGDISLVTGPSPTPLGTGSLHITTTDQNGGPNNAKAQLFNYSYEGTPLADITALSYSAYRSSTSTNNPVQHVGLNIEVDYTGDGSSYTTLVFEPDYQSGGAGALQVDTWQTWDAYDGGNAIWWSSKPIPGVCAYDCYVSWNQILQNNQNAKIVGGIGFNNGSGWAGVSDENADALTIGVNGNTTIYDFEKTPPLFCRIMIWTNQNQSCSFSGPSWLSNVLRGFTGMWWHPPFLSR